MSLFGILRYNAKNRFIMNIKLQFEMIQKIRFFPPPSSFWPPTMSPQPQLVSLSSSSSYSSYSSSALGLQSYLFPRLHETTVGLEDNSTITLEDGFYNDGWMMDNNNNNNNNLRGLVEEEQPSWLDSILNFAVPKKKVSKARKRTRLASYQIENLKNIRECPKCGGNRLLHHLCVPCFLKEDKEAHKKLKKDPSSQEQPKDTATASASASE